VTTGTSERTGSGHLLPLLGLLGRTDVMFAAAVGAAAQVGVADALADGPRSVQELATATGCHAPSLHRLLRALAGEGVFTEVAPGRFGMTAAAEFLRSDARYTARGAFMSTATIRALFDLAYSVRTGEPAYERVTGKPFWDHLAADADENAWFDHLMRVRSRLLNQPALEAYDWSGASTVVDVGGGTGLLLAAVLRRHRHLQGILFDLPHVVRDAPSGLAAAGVEERCQVVAGDMFDGVPAGGDVYLLSSIVHDWDDEAAVAILRRCREAVPPHGRLLLLEMVVPPGNDSHPSKLLDLRMLALVKGRERTREEFAEILSASGFRLDDIVPSPTPACFIVGSPLEAQ
jgi:hypothetical protein